MKFVRLFLVFFVIFGSLINQKQNFMKKVILILMITPLMMFAQTKKSGVVYSDHPALNAVNEMNKDFMDGDIESYKSHFAENVKIWSVGDTESHDLEEDLKWTKWWMDNFVIDIKREAPASADVIKYKGEKGKKGVWVLDWTVFTAINKKSGDTVKTSFHDEFFVNPENKITRWFSFYDKDAFIAQIQSSFGRHRNGLIYDEHPHIETLKQLVQAYEAGDANKMATFFSPDAKFYKKGGGDTENYSKISLTERFKLWENGIGGSIARRMEVYGYPDAIRYEKGEGGWEVLSWWNHMSVTQKGEETTEKRDFIHLSHSFDDEGKITREVLWVE
jgi:hypothetical protein